MFTGIVEAVGEVVRLERSGERARLEVGAPQLAGAVRLGDSVAVNGACLTLVDEHAERLAFEAVPETLERTTLGRLVPGARVNLERALRADGRLDGHIVQGHVDETGRVRSVERHGDDVRLAVGTTPAFAALLVPKGSVAVDGVSLTVVDAGADGFDVALIPYTLAVTTLGALRPGDRVNLEADVLGKYVRRYLERAGLVAAGGVP